MDNNVKDQPISFDSQHATLHGVLSLPQQAAQSAVIIVVGGPQYRVGSHRQFVLLARQLAAHGVLALRFDYTGMGYSEGVAKQFDEIDADIAAAVDFIAREYTAITEINLWGLCDAASAIAFYAYQDSRIKKIVMLNPWVRSAASHSEVILANYYRERFFSIDVWKDLFSSPKKVINAVVSFSGICANVVANLFTRSSIDNNVQGITQEERKNNLAGSVLRGMQRFHGELYLILSENDLTADEFKLAYNASELAGGEGANNITLANVAQADHTFSSAAWREAAEQLTLKFLGRK